MVKFCAALHKVADTDVYRKRGITFHRFPKSPRLRSRWQIFTGRPDWQPSKHSVLCSEHFNASDFVQYHRGRRRLKASAVPSISILTTSLDHNPLSATCAVSAVNNPENVIQMSSSQNCSVPRHESLQSKDESTQTDFLYVEPLELLALVSRIAQLEQKLAICMSEKDDLLCSVGTQRMSSDSAGSAYYLHTPVASSHASSSVILEQQSATCHDLQLSFGSAGPFVLSSSTVSNRASLSSVEGHEDAKSVMSMPLDRGLSAVLETLSCVDEEPSLQLPHVILSTCEGLPSPSVEACVQPSHLSKCESQPPSSAQHPAANDSLVWNWLPRQLPQTSRSSVVQTFVSSMHVGLFKHYTGFNYERFTAISNFLIPDKVTRPFVYAEQLTEIETVCLEDQLFMTLCRLRQGLSLVDLGLRFDISPQAVSMVFNHWIDYMYLRFGSISIWPDREKIIAHMPPDFAKQYPTSMAIIDCTELPINRPSSLCLQSQCYSEYKSTTTVKGLVAIDPRGSVIFISKLFAGSVSDKDIVRRSGFLDLLHRLLKANRLKLGDAIMADKGFDINHDLENLGLHLNIPPRAKSGQQMNPADVEKTKSIAAHRVHVERAIARIKAFKLVGRKVPASLFHKINSIWFVAAFLTNFQDWLIADKNSDSVTKSCIQQNDTPV